MFDSNWWASLGLSWDRMLQIVCPSNPRTGIGQPVMSVSRLSIVLSLLLTPGKTRAAVIKSLWVRTKGGTVGRILEKQGRKSPRYLLVTTTGAQVWVRGPLYHMQPNELRGLRAPGRIFTPQARRSAAQ